MRQRHPQVAAHGAARWAMGPAGAPIEPSPVRARVLLAATRLAATGLVAASLLFSALLPAPARAQSPQARFADVPAERLVDWYYASTFGTGAYRIGDRTVFVGRLPLSYRLRLADEKQWGIRLKLPITVGLYDVSSAFEDILAQNFGTVSILPGVEFERRINPRLTIKPTISLGYGHDAANGIGATIWEAGARTVYDKPLEKTDLVFSAALLYAGYDSRLARQQLGIISAGVAWILPTGKDLFGQPTNFGLHFNYYLYFDRLDFVLDPDGRKTVPQQYEVGVTLGSYQPYRIFGIETDRIGVAVRGGDGLTGVRFLTSFLF